MKRIILVVGTRPNFMKISPIVDALKLKIKKQINPIIVHTGQHYDKEMSENILSDLNFPDPDYFLGVGSGSHAVQTANILIEFEKICLKIVPSLVVVAGDVNSTLACAIVASKLKIKIAHVESGLRSFDRGMPEEINRILTDHVSDFLFTSEKSGNVNLKQEGIDSSKIHFVGNCMIDSLLKHIPIAKEMVPWKKYGYFGGDYIIVTLHRPSNVDDYKNLKKIASIINYINEKVSVLFPMHPRTKSNFDRFNIKLSKTINIIAPQPYIEFLGLVSNAKLVLTDSGGIQEETTMLNIPCVTLRDNTERPITVDIGTNIIAGTKKHDVLQIIDKVIDGDEKNGDIPELWDGKAAERIIDVLENI